MIFAFAFEVAIGPQDCRLTPSHKKTMYSNPLSYGTLLLSIHAPVGATGGNASSPFLTTSAAAELIESPSSLTRQASLLKISPVRRALTGLILGDFSRMKCSNRCSDSSPQMRAT